MLTTLTVLMLTASPDCTALALRGGGECVVWPARPEFKIVVLTTMNDMTATAELIVLRSVDGSVVARITDEPPENDGWFQTYELDLAAYRSPTGARAFGLRRTTQRRPRGGSWTHTTLMLFTVDDSKLTRVLDGLMVSARGASTAEDDDWNFKLDRTVWNDAKHRLNVRTTRDEETRNGVSSSRSPKTVRLAVKNGVFVVPENERE